MIAVGIGTSWAVASALLVLLLTQVVRPFDFLVAFLIVVGGAAFVANAAGGLTFQLGLLSCAVLLMLGCYTLSHSSRVLSIPRTPLTWPLVCYVVLSMANAARGMLSGYSRKYLGLELAPLLALGSAVLVANAFERRRDLRWAVIGLIVIGGITAVRGIQIFAVTRTHGAGYTMAVPGLVGLLLINLALRSKTSYTALGLTLLTLPMFLQQFITFGRGLWSGCIAGLAATALIYARYGRGTRARWKRTALVFGSLAGLGVATAVMTALTLGDVDILREAGTRLTSIAGTQLEYATRSNLIRLGEYLFALDLIRQSPWVGYGIGYTFIMKQAFSADPGLQWYVHQYFLMVWLKQGLVGLALFVWLLVAATWLGVKEARHAADPWQAAWFATVAAATIFLAVFSLSNYPFAVVNEMFLLALLWGGAMAMTRQGFISIRWRDSSDGHRESA